MTTATGQADKNRPQVVAWQGGRALFQLEASTRVCRSYALSQPEENADVAVIRCRSPVVLRVGYLKPNYPDHRTFIFQLQHARVRGGGVGGGAFVLAT